MSLGLTLRPALAEDRTFVQAVHFETQRRIIEKLFGWRGDDIERKKFDEFYDEPNTQIILVDGRAVGWLTVLREADAIELEAIYLTSRAQCKGTGQALIEDLIGESDSTAKPLRLSTTKVNPARRLYERLGFHDVEESEFKVSMLREPRAVDIVIGSNGPAKPQVMEALQGAKPADLIILEEYNARWPQVFEVLSERIRETLTICEVNAIEHVGSTAIPGMRSKPVVDIMVGLDSLDKIPGHHDQLWTSLGFEWGHGDDSDEDWFYFLKRDDEGKRVAHIHIVPFEGQFWKKMIIFRDALRADAKLSDEYSRLKIELASKHRNERLKYLEGKAPFVAAVIKNYTNPIAKSS